MSYKILSALGLLIIFTTTAYSQSPTIQWQKTYGGPQNDAATCIQQTTDGGFIVGAASLSSSGDVTVNHGVGDCWIVKLDASGNIEWQKSYGGAGDEQTEAIRQTADGGYIFAAFTTSNNSGDVGPNHGGAGTFDTWIVKLDATGNISWQKTFGGSEDDIPDDIQQTPAGDYIFVSHSDSNDGDITAAHGSADAWIVKLDAGGNKIWQKSIGGSDVDFLLDIKPTPDGGYIMAGNTGSTDGDVINPLGIMRTHWIVKFDAAVNIQWQKTYGSLAGYEGCDDICVASDGGYIVAGNSHANSGDVTGNHGSTDFWVFKLDASGNLVWQKSLGGTDLDFCNSVRQAADGGYYAVGSINSTDGDVTGNHGLADIWITKLSSTGNLVWQKPLGGIDREFVGRDAFCITSDYGLLITGETSSNNSGDVGTNHGPAGSVDAWVVKLMPVIHYSNTDTSVCSSSLPFVWNGLRYNTEGSYSVVLPGANGADSIPTLNLTVVQSPEVHLGNDTTICNGSTLRLNVSSPNASYTWQDGSGNSFYDVHAPGAYWVNTKVDGCDGADTMLVDIKDCNCEPIIPNAITPNGDGINDQWEISHLCDARCIVSVYNRYGSVVYHSDNYKDDWKGTFGSLACPDGTYYYIMKFIYPGNKNKIYRGNITILR